MCAFVCACVWVREREREQKGFVCTVQMHVCIYMFAGVKDGCVKCVGRGVWCECHMQNIEISSTHICSKYTMSGQCNLVNVL
jgi:hypothetical protein